MLDEKKMKEERDARQAAEDKATAVDMAKIWKPLKDAVLAQGAAELTDYHGKGFVHPPFGWKSPDPAALGNVLETALLAQLSGLLPKLGETPEQAGEKDRDLRDERVWENRRAMELASWGLDFVAQCGGYAQSLAALSRARRELPLTVNPGALREAMLKKALDGGWRSTPDDVSARLIALAAADDVWSETSAWGAARAKAAGVRLDPFADRLDMGHWGAGLIKAGTDRHACAEAAISLMAKYAQAQTSSRIDWSAVGREVGSQLRHNFVRADKFPEVFFEKIPMVFWIGAKSEMGPASKVGALIYQRVLDQAALDPKLKSRLCASAWMGFDRKEIEAFESKFPGESGALLRPAVAAEFSTSVSCVSAVYRLATCLGRPSGSWAAKAFAAHGLEAGTVVDKGWRGSGGTELLVDAMGSVYALREALLIKEQVRSAAKEKALSEGKKAAPALKKGKTRRI